MTLPRSFRLGAAVLLAAMGWFTGCTTRRITAPPPPLLLISMDGFRWDYCALHPAETPRLHQLMQEGISARALIPVYPTNTFPNHYSIVTGLYPAHHGIINNHMFDPASGTFFHYNQAASVHQDFWWGGEPIWVTAIQQGHPSASSFWVGSEAEIKGVRPTFWKPYDYSIPFDQRLAELSGWLRLPAAQRPTVITFYLEEANSAGHNYGPDSPELAATLKLLDDRIGAIMDRLKADGQDVNLIIVSDHGMTPVSADRVVILDDYIDVQAVQVDFDETAAGLRPLTGSNTPALMQALAPMTHAKAYRAQDLPARFHLSGNARIPDIWIVPEEGWQVMRRAQFETAKPKFLKGQHGYDNALDSMHGILIAHGPSFKTGGTVIDPVENIHIYNLMCAALGLKPAPNDGDDRLIRTMLR